MLAKYYHGIVSSQDIQQIRLHIYTHHCYFSFRQNSMKSINNTLTRPHNPQSNRSLRSILSNSFHPNTSPSVTAIQDKCRSSNNNLGNNLHAQIKKQIYQNNRDNMTYFEQTFTYIHIIILLFTLCRKLKFMIGARQYANNNADAYQRLETVEDEGKQTRRASKSVSRITDHRLSGLVSDTCLKQTTTKAKAQLESRNGHSIDKRMSSNLKPPLAVPPISKQNKILAQETYKPAKKETVNYSKFECIVQNTLDIDSPIQLTVILGTGANASVRLGVDKWGKQYAVKVYDKYKLLEPRKLKGVHREIKLMRELNHNNIILLHGAYQDKKQIHVVMEYFQGKTLMQYFRENYFSVPLDVAKSIIRQLIEAVEYMHSSEIYHRDLKLQNILIDPKNNTIKLIDFGFAVQTGGRCEIQCGTPNYMAPQLHLKNQSYDPAKVDIWAAGIVLFYLVEGVFPFRGYDDKDLVRKVRAGTFSIKKGDNIFCNLIEGILNVNPQRRPGCQQILSHEWFSTIECEY